MFVSHNPLIHIFWICNFCPYSYSLIHSYSIRTKGLRGFLLCHHRFNKPHIHLRKPTLDHTHTQAAKDNPKIKPPTPLILHTWASPLPAIQSLNKYANGNIWPITMRTKGGRMRICGNPHTHIHARSHYRATGFLESWSWRRRPYSQRRVSETFIYLFSIASKSHSNSNPTRWIALWYGCGFVLRRTSVIRNFCLSVHKAGGIPMVIFLWQQIFFPKFHQNKRASLEHVRVVELALHKFPPHVSHHEAKVCSP